MIIPYTPNSFAPERPQNEKWAFDYYVNRTAPILAGIGDGGFWVELLPMLAQSHDFVWNIVVAISWMQKHVTYPELSPSFDAGQVSTVVNVDHRKALWWYDRALAGFRAFLDQGGAHGGFVLLSCILFAGFEMQQRKVGDALRLMGNALTFFDRSFFMAPTRYLSATTDDLHRWIIPFFTRKAMEMAMLVYPLSVDWGAFIRNDNRYSLMQGYHLRLRNKKVELDRLMYDVYEITRVTDLIANDDKAKESIFMQRDHHLLRMHQWHHDFQGACQETSDPGLSCVRSLLLLYWNITQIWLSARLLVVQTAFDAHFDGFRIIIEHLRLILKYTSARSLRVGTRDIDLVAPLYFVATKCRDPSLRREAVELLREAPLRDELWSLMASPFVVEKIIEIEEGSSPFLIPAENQRIHQVAIVRQETYEGRLRMQLQVSKAHINSQGRWCMVHENIWVEESLAIVNGAASGSDVN